MVIFHSYVGLPEGTICLMVKQTPEWSTLAGKSSIRGDIPSLLVPFFPA